MNAAAPSPNRNLPLGIADVFSGTLLVLLIWLALPSRWWPVDVFGTGTALALWVVGLALIVGFHWARHVARWVSWVVLICGASVLTLLAWTVSYLMALYGPVGQGGALILATVLALLLPYLVVLPAVHVVALRPKDRD